MKPNRPKFQIGDQMSWQPAGEGVTRKIMGYDNQIMLVQVRFEEGAVAAAHTHFHTQTSFVVSGRFKVTVDGESRELKAGDGFYMEPNSLHEAVCLEPGIILDCFSPMREEFV